MTTRRSPGDWIVVTRGKNSGAVGRVYRVIGSAKHYMPQTLVVQFGADGPFRKYQEYSVRRALLDEIPHGVG